MEDNRPKTISSAYVNLSNIKDKHIIINNRLIQ